MEKPIMIIIEGPSGSGKTTIGDLLHKRLKRTALLGIDRIKWFVSDFRRDFEDNEAVARITESMEREFLAKGFNVLLPQGMWKKEYLDYHLKIVEDFGIDLYMYQLEAPREVLIERIRNRRRKEGSPEQTEGRAERNLDTWEENRYEYGKHISTVDYEPEEVVEIILKDIPESYKV